MPARARARSIARRAPAPDGSGADIWWPSDDSPQPLSATVAGSRVIKNSAAPSPILIPLRFRLSGLQRVALTESSAANPLTVRAHSVSTPPATIASHAPIWIKRAALASALALDAQALEWT